MPIFFHQVCVFSFFVGGSDGRFTKSASHTHTHSLACLNMNAPVHDAQVMAGGVCVNVRHFVTNMF
jgi:hypothetical protein